MARVEEPGHAEPFWDCSGPELLDISITDYCELNCEICYKSTKNTTHIDFSDYCHLIDQISDIGVFQVALGGGNPNLHPRFVDILEYTYSKSIVPNYTTNGFSLSDEILMSSAKYCGAVGVSYYHQPGFNDLVERMVKMGIKINIHIVVSAENIDEIIQDLDTNSTFQKANAIVLLRYKPAGPISRPGLVSYNKTNLSKLFSFISGNNNRFKVGFDSCFVNLMINHMDVDENLIEPCEGGRFSGYISEDLQMYPCSFMEGLTKGVSLKRSTVEDCWKNSELFLNFRKSLNTNSCNQCSKFSLCLGGCPIFFNEFLCSNFITPPPKVKTKPPISK